MKAVVLVGGGGTRLRPLTHAIPKPLVPVLNEPLVAVLLRHLASHGVDEVVLAASASDKRIEEAIGNGCLLYTSPSPRDGLLSRMPSSA